MAGVAVSLAFPRRYRETKYGNKPLRCAQGPMHQSSLEAQQCNVLHALQNAGIVRDLKAHPQVRYRLEVNGIHVCDVMPDFEFVWVEDGKLRTLDTKGFQSEVSKLKCRLFEALYGREIELVRRPWTFR
jgi:hypothetical protein